MNSKNRFYLHEDGYIVGVTKKGEEFYFDLEDFEKVKERTWCIGNHLGIKYVTSAFPTPVYLHRFIMNPDHGISIDHIFHNGCDNRKEKLRICNQQENCRNSTKRKNSTSEFKGVSWYKNYEKWCATITINGKRIHLGYFVNELEASQKYNEAASFYFGEFAFLNII